MTQADVARIMRQPYDSQLFVFGDDTYDLWFYVTSATVLGQSRMMPANLTQIAFKNGILIGWGRGFLNYLNARKVEIEQERAAPLPAPTVPQSDQRENKSLEKILTPTTPTTPQSVTPKGPPPAPAPVQHTTMSRPPDKKEPDPKQVPLTDEDEEMLRDEKQQDFDQT
jgi:hypothetical protein